MTYDSKFLKAFEYMLQNEGYESNDSFDKGGHTRLGISLEFLKQVHLDLNLDGFIDSNDIRAINVENAKKIYYDNFYDRFYALIGERLAIKLFDFSVNAGSGRSHKLLQKALNSLGSNLVVDGVLGNRTLVEISKYKESDILACFCFEQKKFYDAIIAKDPTQAKFKNGWRRRAERLPK
jgi:lysozyme family protein